MRLDLSCLFFVEHFHITPAVTGKKKANTRGGERVFHTQTICCCTVSCKSNYISRCEYCWLDSTQNLEYKNLFINISSRREVEDWFSFPFYSASGVQVPISGSGIICFGQRIGACRSDSISLGSTFDPGEEAGAQRDMCWRRRDGQRSLMSPIGSKRNSERKKVRVPSDTAAGGAGKNCKCSQREKERMQFLKEELKEDGRRRP